ncbi:MobV family relaxase [Hymenobacter sp. IS2118]|uniref:MobV family relaxase n=1 Tax=Hymenobacter sp. IS2118 TaxID=1505605 RepID=UPI0005522B5A|nr:MobV family relaxase [Hymenobacter sp. IS2118]
MKEYTIIRVEKIKTRSGLVQRVQHNERTKDTPNADEARLGLNHEYVNLTGQPILDLLDARTKEAGVGTPRANATLCVEVLLTGGPEAEVWQRAPKTAPHPGRAADMRDSQWANDVVAFARKEWGKNLISLVLHQDEKTPHFQAFVVPLVGAGGGRSGETNPKELSEQLPADEPARRSARDLFTPRRLAQLQTDFSEAMEPHGFKRGIAGSRAHHKTMGEMYGLLEKTAADIAPSLAPVSNERFTVKSPLMNIVTKDWRMDLENQINAELDRMRDEANAKLALAGQVAVAAAGGNEASGRSREWVEKEKKHKVGLSTEVLILELKLSNEQSTVRDLTRELTQVKAAEADLVKRHAGQIDELALHAFQGTLPTKVVVRGKELWEAARERALVAQAQSLAVPLENEAQYHENMRTRGYPQKRAADGTQYLVESRTDARFDATLRPGGPDARPLVEQIAQAVEATRLAAAAAHKARRDRQLADDRAWELKHHREAEYRALQTFGYRIRPDEYLTARVRVPTDAVHGIVRQLGANTATADEKPGKDGLTGINLCYSPRLNGQCTLISDFLKRVESKGGEVYEFPNAEAARQKAAGSDRSSGFSTGLEQSQEKSM